LAPEEPVMLMYTVLKLSLLGDFMFETAFIVTILCIVLAVYFISRD